MNETRTKTCIFVAQVWKSGKSFVITIPRSVAEALSLKPYDKVEVMIKKVGR